MDYQKKKGVSCQMDNPGVVAQKVSGKHQGRMYVCSSYVWCGWVWCHVLLSACGGVCVCVRSQFL